MHPAKQLLLLASSLALVSVLFVSFTSHSIAHAAGASTPQVSLQHVQVLGTTTPQSNGNATSLGNTNQEFSALDLQGQSDSGADFTGTLASPPTTPPNPAASALASQNPGFTGFLGLTHFDSRNANNGNQFSHVPPDQALCVGHDFVLESVNTALAVYSTDTHAQLSGPTANNTFFKQAPEITRTTNPNTFGPQISDPRCIFDASTNRWFVTTSELDTDPATGNLTGRTHVFIAVSQTSNPTGNWTIFSLDVTDDGTNGTPSQPNCPCLGDQPLIGTDATGFYISTNEFSLISNGFNGAQLYALSKRNLAEAAEGNASALPTVVHLDVGNSIATPDAQGTVWRSLEPASSPTQEDEPNHGTEYFLSHLDFFHTLDNRLAVWALTNTRSLDGDGTPHVNLSLTVITTETYGQPPLVTQKPGPFPLGTSKGQPEEKLADRNDDRLQQLVLAHGNLWSALNTIVQVPGESPRMGVAYFIVSPSWQHGNLGARISRQGYVALATDSVLYGTIGANAEGQGVIGFSVVGPDFFPSAGYATVSAEHGAGKVHIAALGAAPNDGFGGYPPFSSDGADRWGDYSAAVADQQGTIWVANEFIPNTPRTVNANWGTFISQVHATDEGGD